MAEKALLEMKGITKYIFDSYGVAIRNTTVKILDKVDFDLRKGEVHILVGEMCIRDSLRSVRAAVLRGQRATCH